VRNVTINVPTWHEECRFEAGVMGSCSCKLKEDGSVPVYNTNYCLTEHPP
jgi:hypothetical protein